jgi:hypothetical protein
MTDRRRLAVGLGAVIVAAALAGCGSDAKPQGSASLSASSPTSSSAVAEPPPAAPAPPPPASDEDQIRQTLMAFQDAYNTQNWPAYNELMCQKMREQFNGSVVDSLKKTRVDNGLTQIVDIKDIKIDGINATVQMDAQNELLGRQTIPIKLAQDADGWKVCMPA